MKDRSYENPNNSNTCQVYSYYNNRNVKTRRNRAEMIQHGNSETTVELRTQRAKRGPSYKHFQRHRLEGTPCAKAFISPGHATPGLWKSADMAQREIVRREKQGVHVKKRRVCTIKFIREKIKDVIFVSWVHVSRVWTSYPLIASCFI